MMSTNKYSLNDQIRMAGEENVRRAGQFDFGNLDFVQKISISVEIDGNNDEICFPDAQFGFTCLNKTLHETCLSDLKNGRS